MRARAAVLAVAVLCAAVCDARAASDTLAPMTLRVVVQQAELEIDAGQTWAKRVEAPKFGDDERLVLALRARAQSLAKGGGGCNYVMQVLLDGAPLVESLLKPRLINKLAWFDPPGTKYHFAWFGAAQQAWTTIFCRDFEGNWAGTGRDYDFIFDLSGLVGSGEATTLAFRHAMPGLPAAVKRDRAPLVLDRVVLGVMKATDVERLRKESQKGLTPRDVAIEAKLPADAKPGDRAYEIVWSGRKESPPAQIVFEDLAGWTLGVMGDAKVSLAASVDHLIWRQQTAKLAYGGGTQDTVAVLRPPKPVVIADKFDAANLWLYGAVDRYKDRRLRFLALLEDANGHEFQVDLGPLTSCYWNLLHGVLDAKTAARVRWPAKFTALVIENLKVPDASRCVYLESLAFYQQNRKPFAKLDRPKRPVFPTSDDGMLPTPPKGVKVSAAATDDGAEFISKAPDGALRFRVRPADGCLHGVTAQWNDGPVFRPMEGGGVRLDLGSGEIVPADAKLVSAVLKGNRLIANWRVEASGFGVPASAGGPPRRPTPAEAGTPNLRNSAEWNATYHLRGRTLVVDVKCAGGAATGVVVGQVSGLQSPRGIEVPYLMMGRKPGPWIACAGVACNADTAVRVVPSSTNSADRSVRITSSGGLFVSVLPDFYHSDFSSVDTTVTHPTAERIRLLKGTVYTPLTNGRRNDLRERMLVTVSPEFAEALPNTRNPVSPNRGRLAPYAFYMGRASSQKFYGALKRHGIDHLIASDFAAVLVDDYAEGFGLRWRPHPALRIGQVQDWRRGIRSLGFLFGFYIDGTDYWPGNEWFDENKVCLTPDGDLRDAWYGNFATKFNAMPHLVRWTGEKAKRHYPADCVYLDVHTNRGLEAMDYEAGVEGAGMARALVFGNGDSILEARKWYGSTISEGICRWLYAGVCDMDYATLIASTNAPALPPLVDFDLLKIHPFQHGTMMGHGVTAFFGQTRTGLHTDGGRGAAPLDFYRYVSASLAYGHMLILGYGYVPPLSRFIHYYAVMQGVQREYLTDTAAEISYHNGSEFVPTSRALIEDSQKLGRVRVRYSRGLTVHVNYNADKLWTVECDAFGVGADVRRRSGGVADNREDGRLLTSAPTELRDRRRFQLPPFGWLIVKPREILAYSALVGDKRVDFVQCPDYIYLNAGDARAREGPLEVEGAVWLKRDGNAWRLIPCGYFGQWKGIGLPHLTKFCSDFELPPPPADRGCKHIVLDTRALLGKPAAKVAVTARDAAGAPVSAKTTPLGDGRMQVAPDAAAVDYVLK